LFEQGLYNLSPVYLIVKNGWKCALPQEAYDQNSQTIMCQYSSGIAFDDFPQAH